MKQLQNLLTVVVLLLCFKITQAQPSTSLFQLLETPLSQGWWEISTNPKSKWKVGKIVPTNEMSQSPGLFLSHKVGHGDDLAIMHSASYQLPNSASLWLSLELDCDLSDPSSIFRLDLWDGESWRAMYVAHRVIHEKLWLDISQFQRDNFQMKLVYKSQGNTEEKIAIHSLEVHREGPSKSPESFMNLDVFPNPFQAELNVNFFVKNDEVLTLQVIDIQGKIWKDKGVYVEAGFNNISLNLEELPVGIYTISVKQKEHITYRLVQKR